MDYETTQELFFHMDNLETNSSMYNREISKDDPNWKAAGSYCEDMQLARKGIFDIMKGISND